MKLSDIGERKAIELLSQNLSRGDTAVWIGDDCAALDLGDDYLLVTTDMVAQQTHIPHEMTPFQLGWFIVAINLSDIAAKGGTPLGLVLSLGLPKDTTELFLKKFAKGANTCATKFGTSIVGGDTKETDSITISGTAFGRVNKDEFMPRKGAKQGDIVAVTGTLGKAGAGYYALKRNIRDAVTLRGLLEPLPRLYEGRALSKEKIISSCIDISDGLSSSLYQLQAASKVGFEIDKEKIPLSAGLLHTQEQLKIDGYKVALHFGGDYELLVTMPPDTFKKALKIVKNIGNDLTVIGKITTGKNIMLVSPGSKKVLPDQGYEHFKKHVF